MSGDRTTKLEIIPAGETAERREVARLTAQLQRRRRAHAGNQGELLRGVHPKSHGCIDARLIINKDLPSRFRVGVFAEPGRRYQVRVRYSNADVLVLPDIEADGRNRSRGMAIKILDVGKRAVVADKGGAVNQDFLLINTPVFAFGTVRAYARLTRALMLDPGGAEPDLFFLPLKLAEMGILDPATGALAPPAATEPPQVAGLRAAYERSGVFDGFGPADFAETLRSFEVVELIQSKTVRNPLEVPYFGASAYRFGRGRVMRLSIAPEGGAPEVPPFTPEELAALHPDHLAHALKRTLTAGKRVRLSVRLQLARIAELEGRIPEMIEDATRAWDETEFPSVEVARLAIPAVSPKADLVDACKDEAFTPWHTLSVHRPLGGINRLRRPVYDRSARTRTRRGWTAEANRPATAQARRAAR